MQFLISISLVVNKMEHFLCAFWSFTDIIYLLHEVSLQIFFSVFFIALFFFLLILDICPLSYVHFANVFSVWYFHFFNQLGWHCLIRLYRFQMHSSMICVFAHHQSQIFCHRGLTPFTLYYSHPSPPVTGNCPVIVCVCKFLFVFLVCSLVAFSFVSHMWVKPYGSSSFPSDLLHLA